MRLNRLTTPLCFILASVTSQTAARAQQRACVQPNTTICRVVSENTTWERTADSVAPTVLPFLASYEREEMQIAPTKLWPVRAPWGTTVRCPFSYVGDFNGVRCWGGGSALLVLIEGPKCWGDYCRAWRHGYYWYHGVYWHHGHYHSRHGCYAHAEERRLFLGIA